EELNSGDHSAFRSRSLITQRDFFAPKLAQRICSCLRVAAKVVSGLRTLHGGKRFDLVSANHKLCHRQRVASTGLFKLSKRHNFIFGLWKLGSETFRQRSNDGKFCATI